MTTDTRPGSTLAEQVRGLRDVLASLNQRLRGELSADDFAYALLTQGSTLQPWTGPAEQAWREATGSDEWRDHHRAILHHARAYDLEAQRSDEAFEHWAAALRHWARLYQRDEFWQRLRNQVSLSMGIEVSARLVAQVRERLPYDLLAPNLALATVYRVTLPDRGRRHVRLVVESGFPPAVLTDLRDGLVREVVLAVPDAVEEGRIPQIIDTIESWLQLDPTNLALVRGLLYAHRKSLEGQWYEDDRQRLIGASIARVELLVRPALARAGGSLPQALIAEAGRHEYWLGVAALDRSSAAARRSFDSPYAERDGRTAVRQFEAARRQDPTIAMDQWYSDIDYLEAQAQRLVAASLANRGFVHDAVPFLRRATALLPMSAGAWMELAQVLTLDERSTRAELIEAERALNRAVAAVGANAPEDFQQARRKIAPVLDFRRSQFV